MSENNVKFGKATLSERIVTGSGLIVIGAPAAIYLDDPLLGGLFGVLGMLSIHWGYWEIRKRAANAGESE